MITEILDMPDLTEIFEDAASFQRRERLARELTSGAASLPSYPKCNICFGDLRFHQNTPDDACAQVRRYACIRAGDR